MIGLADALHGGLSGPQGSGLPGSAPPLREPGVAGLSGSRLAPRPLGVKMYYKDDKLEYPPSHVGKRTYVTCQGIAYSVPKIYCYYAQGKYYLNDGEVSPEGSKGPMVMRDLAEYKSPLDGSRISSRSAHRDHMRRHGVIEMGNEYPKPRGEVPMDRARYDISRAMERR